MKCPKPSILHAGCRMPCLYVNDCRLTTARTPRNACFRWIHGLLVSRLWRVVAGACDFTDWLRVVSAAMRTWENVGWEKPGREQTHEDDAARTAACCIGITTGWNPSTGSSIAATRDNPTDLDIVYMFDSRQLHLVADHFWRYIEHCHGEKKTVSLDREKWNNNDCIQRIQLPKLSHICRPVDGNESPHYHRID